MKKIYFITGSQDLYGEEVLKTVAKDSQEIVNFLDEQVGERAKIEFLGVVRDSDICLDFILKANYDKECIGIITWMHTFSKYA